MLTITEKEVTAMLHEMIIDTYDLRTLREVCKSLGVKVTEGVRTSALIYCVHKDLIRKALKNGYVHSDSERETLVDIGKAPTSEFITFKII